MTDGKKESSINPSMGELESSHAEYIAEKGFSSLNSSVSTHRVSNTGLLTIGSHEPIFYKPIELKTLWKQIDFHT